MPRMYSEGENKRFLLGAKLFDRDCAFIFASNASLQSAITEYLQASLGSISLPSMSYDSGRSSFAAAGDVVRPMNFGAGRVMRQESDKPTFLFTMNSCQQCDSEKGLFTCGGEREDERESLARMVYVSTTADCVIITITITIMLITIMLIIMFVIIIV